MQAKLIIIGVVALAIFGLSTTVYIMKLKIDNLSQQIEFQKASYEATYKKMQDNIVELENKKQQVITKYETIELQPNSSCEAELSNIKKLLNVFYNRGY